MLKISAFYLHKQKSLILKKYEVYHVPWIVLSSANRCRIVWNREVNNVHISRSQYLQYPQRTRHYCCLLALMKLEAFKMGLEPTTLLLGGLLALMATWFYIMP